MCVLRVFVLFCVCVCACVRVYVCVCVCSCVCVCECMYVLPLPQDMFEQACIQWDYEPDAIIAGALGECALSCTTPENRICAKTLR